MELLYFIAGILSVGVVYGIVLLNKVKSTHTDLLAKTDIQSNLSSIQITELREEVEEFKKLIFDVRSQMDKDQYESLTGINKRLEELDKVAYGNLEKADKNNQVIEKNISTLFSELGQVKQTVKIMSQDPNFTRTF